MKRIIMCYLLLHAMLLFGENKIRLDAQQATNYNVFYVANLDPNNPQNQPIFFTFTVTNISGDSQLPYSLKCSFFWNDTALFQDQWIEADNPLMPNVPVQIASNQIISNTDVGGFSSHLKFDDVLNANGNFKDRLLETGRFPDGTYRAVVQAYDKNPSQSGRQALSEESTFVMNIVNPLSTLLVSPGFPLNTQPQTVNTLTPVFVWVSNLSRFQFKLFELDTPNFDQDYILNLSPYFSQEVTTTTFGYPSSAPAFKSGKYYAWAVIGYLSAPGQTSNNNSYQNKSNIYVFKYDPTATGNVQVTENLDSYQALVALLDALPSTTAKQAIDLLNSGYRPTGKISFDGEATDLKKIRQILQLLKNGQLHFSGMSIE